MLMINNMECTDHKLISEEVYRFDAHLYSSSYSREDSDTLFKSIKTHIPTISTDFSDLCKSKIQLWEMDNAIKQLSSGKAPGKDGLSSNFLIFWGDDIKDLLFLTIRECFTNKILTPTMKQGLITLIPKPGKDKKKKKKYVENLRPIILLAWIINYLPI